MYREHGQSISDIYANDFVTKVTFGRKTMDRNTTRMQSSELTGTTQKMDTGARQKQTDDIYENADAMRGKIKMEIKNSNMRRIQPSEHAESDCVNICRNSRAAVVCLVLLCVLLLTAVIVLCVTLTQERQQFISKTENLTNERDQLRNALQFHVGWTCYQSSFYYMSNQTNNWTESKTYCKEKGADLIIINSQEEQDFVKSMSGSAAVWIGLSYVQDAWKWVDGSTLTSRFWAPTQPNRGTAENCAMTVAVPQPEFANLVGWSDVTCNGFYQWICEKRISQFILP